jgi:hypothetical protein
MKLQRPDNQNEKKGKVCQRGSNFLIRQSTSFLRRDVFAILTSVFLLAACDRGAEPVAKSASETAPASPPKLTPDQLAAAITQPKFFFLDVRSPQEIAELGTLSDYVNIPIEELEDRLSEIPPDRVVVTA